MYLYLSEPSVEAAPSYARLSCACLASEIDGMNVVLIRDDCNYSRRATANNALVGLDK